MSLLFFQNATASEPLKELSGDSILLVGVNHDTHTKELMGPDSFDFFNQHVLENLKNDNFSAENTIILREGRYTDKNKGSEVFGNGVTALEIKSMLPPGTSEYATRYFRIDFRTHPFYYFEERDSFERNLHCIEIKNKLEAESLKSDKIAFTLKNDCVDANFSGQAKALSRNNRKLEAYYANLASKLVLQGYKVVIIVGGIHAARLAYLYPKLKTDYIIDLKGIDEKKSEDIDKKTFIDLTLRNSAIDQIYFKQSGVSQESYFDFDKITFELAELPLFMRSMLAVAALQEIPDGELKIQYAKRKGFFYILAEYYLAGADGAVPKPGTQMTFLSEEATYRAEVVDTSTLTAFSRASADIVLSREKPLVEFTYEFMPRLIFIENASEEQIPITGPIKKVP